MVKEIHWALSTGAKLIIYGDVKQDEDGAKNFHTAGARWVE